MYPQPLGESLGASWGLPRKQQTQSRRLWPAEGSLPAYLPPRSALKRSLLSIGWPLPNGLGNQREGDRSHRRLCRTSTGRDRRFLGRLAQNCVDHRRAVDPFALGEPSIARSCCEPPVRVDTPWKRNQRLGRHCGWPAAGLCGPYSQGLTYGTLFFLPFPGKGGTDHILWRVNANLRRKITGRKGDRFSLNARCLNE
jgi:hypothetical protein